MEKFGIFELLDALSALTEENPPQKEEPLSPGKNAAPDGAFAPPAYGEQPPKGTAGAEALQGFLARHDAVARKADPRRKN